MSNIVSLETARTLMPFTACFEYAKKLIDKGDQENFEKKLYLWVFKMPAPAREALAQKIMAKKNRHERRSVLSGKVRPKLTEEAVKLANTLADAFKKSKEEDLKEASHA